MLGHVHTLWVILKFFIFGRYDTYYFLTSECSTSQEHQKLVQAGSYQDEQAAAGGLVAQDAAQLKQGDYTYKSPKYLIPTAS